MPRVYRDRDRGALVLVGETPPKAAPDVGDRIELPLAAQGALREALKALATSAEGRVERTAGDVRLAVGIDEIDRRDFRYIEVHRGGGAPRTLFFPADDLNALLDALAEPRVTRDRARGVIVLESDYHFPDAVPGSARRIEVPAGAAAALRETVKAALEQNPIRPPGPIERTSPDGVRLRARWEKMKGTPGFLVLGVEDARAGARSIVIARPDLIAIANELAR